MDRKEPNRSQFDDWAFDERRDFHNNAALQERNEERKRKREEREELEKNLARIFQAVQNNQGVDGIDLGITALLGGEPASEQTTTTDGWIFYLTDGSSLFVDFETATAGYTGSGDFFLEFAVSSGAFSALSGFGTNPTTATSGGPTNDRWDNVGISVGSPQTKFFLPIYKNGQLVTSGGVLREGTIATTGGAPVQVLTFG